MTDVVRQQFEDQIAHYTNERRSTSRARSIPFLASWLPAHAAGETVRIVEFGGADGILLRRIAEETPGVPLELYNAELVKTFAGHQALDTIRFVETSILDPGFPDRHFDVVIARNVLHHLIDRDLSSTRDNQGLAIAQLARLIRPGGIILLEEMTNHSAAACRILFELSRFNARFLRLRIPRMEVTPNTVIAFMTPRQILDAAERHALSVASSHFDPATVTLPWKLTGLRRRTGMLFLALETR